MSRVGGKTARVSRAAGGGARRLRENERERGDWRIERPRACANVSQARGCGRPASEGLNE